MLLYVHGYSSVCGACIGFWSCIREENRPPLSSRPLFIAPQWGMGFVHPSSIHAGVLLGSIFVRAITATVGFVCAMTLSYPTNAVWLQTSTVPSWYFHPLLSSELWAWWRICWRCLAGSHPPECLIIQIWGVMGKPQVTRDYWRENKESLDRRFCTFLLISRLLIIPSVSGAVLRSCRPQFCAGCQCFNQKRF